MAISIHELNADDIVEKLSIIEEDPKPIWEGFVKYYGNGFFNKMIEKEFGINPDTHEEIGNKFGQEVDFLRIEMNDKFQQISQEAKDHIEKLKKKMKQKQTEVLALKENQEEEIAKIRKEIFSECEKHFIREKASDFEKYDEERSELYSIIRELELKLEGKGINKPKTNAKTEEIKLFLSQLIQNNSEKSLKNQI